MGSLQEFTQRVRQVKGVGSYLLMRGDGRILAHDVAHPDGVSSLMALAGLSSRSIQKTMGFSRFKYLVVGRTGRENLMVFPLGPYLLGVLQAEGASGVEVAGGIMRLLEKIKIQN